MFDDVKNPNQNNSLGDIPRPPQRPIPSPTQAEDILSGLDTGTPMPAKPDVFRPKPRLSSEEIARMQETESEGFGFNSMKKFMILIAVLLGLAVILWAGWYGLNKFLLNKNSGDLGIDSGAGEEASQTGNSEEPVNAENSEVVAQPLDSDQDGLTDEEETALGLNIGNVDSDSDGLFDREEVKVYKTDPLKADSDGDSYSDGDEVKNGFNPLGAGRLFEINQ